MMMSREKNKRLSDLFRRLDEHVGPISRPSLLFPVFQLLMRVFDHDDGRVYHRADRDRDTAERHDVGRKVQLMHRNERDDDRDRKCDDDDQGARQMEEKHDDDDTDDQAFLDQLFLEGGNRSEDQIRTVVGRDDLDARRAKRARSL